MFKFFGNLNMFFSRFRVTVGFKVMPECFWTAVNWDADFYFSDFNMDGFARATGGATINDYLYLVSTILNNDPVKIIKEHQ